MSAMLMTAAASILATPTVHLAERQAVDLERLVPRSFADWEVDPTVVPILPSPDQQAVIDSTYDYTLMRTYRNTRGDRIMLAVAYSGAVDDGKSGHRPEICYPAQGFTLQHETVDATVMAASIPLPVKRLVASRSERNEPITYWVVVGEVVTAFGLQHKLATLKYGLAGRVPDGMFVRISSVDRDNEAAFGRHAAFIADLLDAVEPEHRRRLMGVRTR